MMPQKSIGTILIVDDQESNIAVVGTTLSAMGYEILPATSGEQALARVEARTPDLILLDIVMPEMDGFQVCTRLKSIEATARIPVIFLSAADDHEVVVRAFEAGGVDYITKPFNKSELQARVRTHIDLKRARDQLQEVVQQREELTGMLAHDLKNALFGIQLSAKVLQSHGEHSPEEVAQSTAAISGEAKSALELVDSFLSRIADDRVQVLSTPVEVDVAQCTEAVVKRNLCHAKDKNITLHWQPPENGPVVYTDPAIVREALHNLVSNALKFSPPSASVWVSVDAQTTDIVVRDEGPGFTEEDKKRMFERFARLSAKPTAGETSTGLGLRIAKNLIDLVGGTLTCTSVAGQGAEFRISLPLEPPLH
ncbi:MAG: hybrid sensor histidine kinase/response regulator [Planctomycetota bacterium]